MKAEIFVMLCSKSQLAALLCPPYIDSILAEVDPDTRLIYNTEKNVSLRNC